MAAQVRAAEVRRQRALAKPLDEVARVYLAAVADLVDAEAAETQDEQRPPEAEAAARAARPRVAEAAADLGFHGFPKASDESLIGHHRILARLISIQLARPVGYRLENLLGVLNAIDLSKGTRRADFSLYLIALKVYPPPLAEKQKAWCDDWARRVRESIQAGEAEYLRDPAYDRLLSMLFPEMAAALAKPGGKRPPSRQPPHKAPPDAHRAEVGGQGGLGHSRAPFFERRPNADGLGGRLLDTRPDDDYLKGRDLERWKRANPESAKDWFGYKDGG